MARDNKLKTIQHLLEIEVVSYFAKAKSEADKGNYGRAERLSGVMEGLETASRIIRSISVKEGTCY